MKKQKNKEWKNIKKEYPKNPIYYKRYNYIFVWSLPFIITVTLFSASLGNFLTLILGIFTAIIYLIADAGKRGFIYREVK